LHDTLVKFGLQRRLKLSYCCSSTNWQTASRTTTNAEHVEPSLPAMMGIVSNLVERSVSGVQTLFWRYEYFEKTRERRFTFSVLHFNIVIGDDNRSRSLWRSLSLEVA
jgi:hypothetical protein